MKQQGKNSIGDLKWFLIWRFLLIMAGVYLYSELLSVLYRYSILPELFEKIQGQEITITNQESIPGVIFGSFLYLLSDFLPGGGAGLLRRWVSANLESVPQIHIGMVQHWGIRGKVFEIALMLLFFALLCITMLPYVIGALLYGWIVTKRVNKLMEQEKEQQRQYEKQRNLLLSDIAHDIKTPLTTICGYSKALSDGVVQEERKRQEYLDAVYAKSMRMNELLSLLFEYVKLDSEGFAFHLEKTDFAELVRENTAQVYADFEARGMILTVELPEHAVFYRLDRLQMSRAVMNLLTNAVRYGRENGRVLVRLQDGVLTVADDGMQIEEEFAEHIFEPFARADRARSTRGGSGLGLSISAKIVEMHGGRLELNRAFGEGYTKAFQIRLETDERFSA